MKFSFLILISFLISGAFAQNSTSQIYSKQRLLIANSNYKLDRSRFTSWSSAEASFLHYFIANIKFPQIYRENNIEDTLIVSFTLDEKSNVTTYAVVHTVFGTESAFVYELKRCIAKSNQYLIDHSIILKKGTYYLPIIFKINSSNNYPTIENGWIKCWYKFERPRYVH